MPTVSVLTTSFNREAYVAQTIETVLTQSFTDFEYIIVDDCSHDRSFEIAQSYAAKDSRIRAYQNETNLGDYPNRRKAVELARGEFVKFIDSDDLLYPHALDVMVRCMRQFPLAALGLVRLHTQSQPLPMCISPTECYRAEFFGKGTLGNAPGSAIFRRDSYHAVGGFTGKRYVGDYELWLKFAAKFDVVFIPGYLGWDRKHDVQESSLNVIDYSILGLQTAMAALTFPECPFSANEKALAMQALHRKYRRYAIRLGIRHGNLVGAIRLYRATTQSPN